VTTYPVHTYTVDVRAREAHRMTTNMPRDEERDYEIRVFGRLDDRWSDWFSGLRIAVDDVGGAPITRLSGAVDQARLRGILNRLWDLNLTLLSVTRDVQYDSEA